MHEMLETGRVTKEPTRIRQWVGVFLVRHLVNAMFKDALLEGTLLWDWTLARVLSILLLSSLSARVGEISRGKLTEFYERPCMIYENVTVAFKNSGMKWVEDLVARIKIRNEKGLK